MPDGRADWAMALFHPVENVADDGPAPLTRGGILSENPVLEGGVERAVLALQRHPGVDEGGEPLVALADAIRQRNPDRIRAWDDHRVGGVDQRPRRASFGRQG